MEENVKKYSAKKVVALRDFECCFNKLTIKIKKGDDISELNLDEKLLTNLITEKVIRSKNARS